jgi:VWFA-related protein
MKKGTFIIGILIIILFLSGQEIQEEAMAINIEVPVRVFKGDTFIDNLTIDDFEIYEDGVLQDIEAVYYIKKTNIERHEEKKKFAPKTQRHFFLFFEIEDYAKRLKDGMNYFFENVLIPSDNLTIVSPRKMYRFESKSFEKMTREEIVEELGSILRKDAVMGSSEYRSAIHDIQRMTRQIAAKMGNPRDVDSAEGDTQLFQRQDLDEIFSHYIVLLEKLESLRRVDEQKMLDFANYLQDMDGQKFVILFYQREFIPQLDSRILEQVTELYQDMPNFVFQLQTVYGLSSRDVSIDVQRVKQAYSDSSISIHFLFFTKPAEHVSGVQFVERSEDIFSAFSEMALATGGFVESSSNPEHLLQKASEATENYYLVYYSPKNYLADGKFKNIKVKVKGKSYRVTHRAGYIAD